MFRCRECARPIEGSDVMCAACRHHEWIQTRKAIDDMNAEYWKEDNRKRSGIVKGIGIAILTLLMILFIANIPDALEYEAKKYENARYSNER